MCEQQFYETVQRQQEYQEQIDFEEALNKFYGDFSEYIYRNEFVGNGDMLLTFFEDADYFVEHFMKDEHPELEVV